MVLASDACAIVDGATGVRQGRYQAVVLARQSSVGQLGQGDMVSLSWCLGTSSAHIQILIKLVEIHIGPQLSLI